MRVFYTGRYREPSVNYKGVPFMDGVATEVSAEWWAANQGDKLALEVNPPVIDEPEAPKRRGRPPKVSNDNDD